MGEGALSLAPTPDKLYLFSPAAEEQTTSTFWSGGWGEHRESHAAEP
ncbi:MAG: hypothetical protein HC927_07740 [Deltaproteobacteria bacterium]|nr:hypothetical protein [Deltaproteobacteria bacterium]